MGIPCENNHRHGESYCKVEFNGKYLCLQCVNDIGDFDRFGPLSVPNKKRDEYLAQKQQGAKVFVPGSPPKAAAVKDVQNSYPPAPQVNLLITTTEKKCSICGQTLPLSNFENDKRRPDGHGPRCKECVKKRAAERRVL